MHIWHEPNPHGSRDDLATGRVGGRVDQVIEDKVRAQLVGLFGADYRKCADDYISNPLECKHNEPRFAYLRPVIGPEAFNARSRILISGCGAGSGLPEAFVR